MKIVIKYVLMLIIGLGSLQAVDEAEGKKCNDLIMILDDGAHEKIDGIITTLATEFGVAILQKAAPILVSSNIVENFCFWKTAHKEMLSTVKQEALTVKNMEKAEAKAKQLSEQLEEAERFDRLGFVSVFLSFNDLKNDDWYCYVHKSADLVLLIPKKYAANRVNASVDANTRIRDCGFNVTNLNPIANLSPDSLLRHLKEKNIQQVSDIIKGIESMLIPDTSSDGDVMVSWNIYLVGHGLPAKKKKFLKHELDITINNIKTLEKNIKIFDQDKTDEGQKKLESSRMRLESERKQHDFLSKLLTKVKKFSDAVIIPEASMITGIQYDDFFRLMKFFSENMNVSFLFYNTCYSGGYNQALVSEILWKIKSDFIVATAGSSETATSFSLPELKFNESGTGIISENPLNFIDFFGMLEDLFGEQLGSIEIKSKTKRKLLKKAPIQDIIMNVIDKDLLYANQPFVRMPFVGVFKALEVDKEVKILTKSMVKEYKKEGKMIDFSESGIKQVVVYPKYIGVPLKAKPIGWLSPVQEKVSKKIQSKIHIFEEIFCDNMFNIFIADLIFLNSSYSKISFVIKKLHCLDYENSGLGIGDKKPLIIENMIVQIKGDLSKETSHIDTRINVVFTCNQKNYGFSFKISNLTKNTDGLLDYLQLLSISPVTVKEFNNFTQAIFDSKDISDIRSSKQEITPQLMVEQFQKKIGKEYTGKKVVTMAKKVIPLPKKSEPVPSKKETMQQKKIVSPSKKEEVGKKK